MDPSAGSASTPQGFVPCPRHPSTITGIRCTRCDSPVCPECMIAAPVGYHCPECVERARKEFKLGAARRGRMLAGAKVTPILIGIIIVGYLAQQASVRFENWALLLPEGIASGEYWRLLTVTLVHGGLWHLAINMLALYNIGTILEAAIGRGRYLALFLVSGLTASAASYAFGQPCMPAVGASGAIFGVFGGLLAYMLRRRHTATGRSALNQLLFWLGLNLLIGFSFPGIDWRAHVGGLAAGFVTGFAVEEADAKGFGKGAIIGTFIVVGAAAVALVLWRTAQLQNFPFFTCPYYR